MDRSSLSAPAPIEAGSPAEGSTGWRAVLAGTPREVLARLVQGDPVGVRGIVARRLRSGSLLLDADRVHLRSVARIARAAGRYRGKPGLEGWVDGHVVHVLGELVREDHEAAKSSSPGRIDVPGVFRALAGPLGLDPASMRRACALFNVLPLADRAAFVELVLRHRSLDELARELGESATQLARRARRALEVLLEAARPAGEATSAP